MRHAAFHQVGRICETCGDFVPDHAVSHSHDANGKGVTEWPATTLTTACSGPTPAAETK